MCMHYEDVVCIHIIQFKVFVYDEQKVKITDTVNIYFLKKKIPKDLTVFGSVKCIYSFITFIHFI